MLNNSFELESQYSAFPFNDDSIIEDNSFESQSKEISLDKMLDIFKDKSENIEEPKRKTNLFITSECTNDTSLKNKKRGRPTDSEKENKKIHDKFSSDNIKRKIQVHYLTFIIYFINDILKSSGIKDEFKKLSYDFKKVVSQQKFNLLKSSTIGEIVSNKISTKYKKNEENHNSKLYDIFKTNEVLEKIFDMNYLDFFKMYYMKNKTSLDLKIFGIEKEITLSKKTETYYDLLEKLKKEEDEGYIKLINDCINKHYRKEKKFVLCC